MDINTKSSISGIILTGGISRRMGKDKAFMKLGNKYFIEIAISVMSELCDEILISTNTQSYDSLGYRTVVDETPGTGPIGGIYSCLIKSKNEHNLIIPVDTPFIKKEVYEQILLWKDEFQHIVAVNYDQLPEPLHACYHKDLAGILKRFIMMKNYKIQELSKHIGTKSVPINKSLDFFSDDLFLNVNDESDMRKIMRQRESR